MVKNDSNCSEGEGNTKLHPKRDTARKMWCFTLNNYTTEEVTMLKQWLVSSGKYIIGFEVGEKGTPHIQGYIHLNKKNRLSALKKINERIHWEPCKGTEEENIIYCSKEKNFEIYGLKPVKPKKPLKILATEQLYDWQKDIVNIINQEPDDRSIHWYWEPKGNVGKTTFMKYLMAKYDAIPIEGKKNDILYCAAEYESDIYIFDFERSMEDYVSYSAMEKIKNGAYMCSKYESKPIIRNPPHVICFANFEPDKDNLSADRWIVKKIT